MKKKISKVPRVEKEYIAINVSSKTKALLDKIYRRYPALAGAKIGFQKRPDGTIGPVFVFADDNEETWTAKTLLEEQEYMKWSDRYMWNVYPQWREFFPDRRG